MKVIEQNKIIEGNKIIAEFMGYKYHLHPDSYALPGWKFPNSKAIPLKLIYNGLIGVRPYLCRTTKDLRFHSSWDWLHPAWEKFRDLKLSLIDEGFHDVYSRHCRAISTAIYAYPISVAFERLVDGIKWYNLKSKT